MSRSGMIYKVEEDRIKAELPLTSQGKFRCKKRSDIQAFGESFGPKKNIITEDSYLEWQIGYDTIIGRNEKPTKLKAEKFKFKGANKKNKHPYELSEIAYHMCKIGLISKDD
ncbi:MAG: restriction endonuclease, partial [Clostridia bacterium]|nr:restriction endonuclease [Clostridia bacterium]